MKLSTFCILYALFFYYGLSFGQVDFQTKDKEIYKRNKVKQMLQWSYDYVNGNPGTNGYISRKLSFDNKGNTLEEINYKANGNITSVVTYSYDANGNLKSFSRYSGNKEKLTYNQNIEYDDRGNKLVESGYDGISSYKNNFIYNSNNQLIEITYTTDKVLTEKRTLKYSGNMKEMTISNINQSILSKEISTYDVNKNIIEEVKYVQDKISQKSDYSYDPSGKRIEETKQNLGNFLYRRKYSYDGKGNVIKILEEKPEGITYDAYIYKYDNMGNVSEERWTKDNTSEYSTKINKYDANNLLVESNCYFASYKFSVLYIYTYEY